MKKTAGQLTAGTAFAAFVVAFETAFGVTLGVRRLLVALIVGCVLLFLRIAVHGDVLS